LHWKDLGFDTNGFANNFDQQVTQPIRHMASESIDVSSLLEGVFGGVSEHVTAHYNKYLYQGAKLQDIPDTPRFVFNATSLQTGVLWRFTKAYMGDWKVGLVNNPDVELAIAVAASSAFPPLLSPCVLNLDPNGFDPKIPAAAGVKLPDFRQKIVLADGGVYDNLGMETAWKNNKTVLVSNGGGTLALEVDPKHDWLGQTNRVLSIIYSQVVLLRTRDIVALYQMGVRDGSYWGIGSNISNYQLKDALVCPPAVTAALAGTPTRLTAVEDSLQEQLIDWGYAICDAAVRAHVLKDAPAPAQSPYGTFKKA
ncbi:MAG TPA: hypothetical protein VE779_02745, partial [Candidatus Angelobacter sp.]|nr:hypothetical protein [Candidatus Angelobacter sp.]